MHMTEGLPSDPKMTAQLSGVQQHQTGQGVEQVNCCVDHTWLLGCFCGNTPLPECFVPVCEP